ncbi:phage-related protein [Nitrosomonas nitrosa]|uniref:type II toxin-antitoxin system RelE/ParE family toxin n=1 Tax=Nitrosomonas nitrosa TaxID=52442 RepID=UPI000D318039|nr:type II toxin-antitoxin system RelE/ParE family toxin [Nitrosomonas nitrosa]PTR04648.1 phage-related protein [Nitrosomonas nitrosa]
MAWTITFFNEKVEAETLRLPPGILANFLRIAELIQEFGPDLGRPHTAPLGRGLFEIRAKGHEGISRSVFCTVKNKEIVILMTVIKKGNKIPKRQMETAQKRLKEVQSDDT